MYANGQEGYFAVYQDVPNYSESPFAGDQSHLKTALGNLGVVPSGAEWGTELNGSSEQGLWTSGAWLESAHVSGEVYANYFEGNSGNIAGFEMAGNSLAKFDASGLGMELISSNQPAIRLVGTNNQNLFIGGDYSFQDIDDHQAYINADGSVVSTQSSSDDSFDQTFTAAINSADWGRTISYGVSVDLSAFANKVPGYTRGKAHASVDLIFKIRDSANNTTLYSETVSFEVSNAPDSDATNSEIHRKTFSVKIPDNADQVTCEVDLQANASQPSGSSASSSSSASVDGDDNAVLQIVKEYLSPQGFNMSNEGGSGGYKPRIHGKRENGELLGHLLTIEGPAGHLAHFRMDSGGTLHLEDDSGAQKDSWPGF